MEGISPYIPIAIIFSVIYLISVIMNAIYEARIDKENKTDISKERQIRLLLGKEKARVYHRNNGRTLSVNRQDVKYTTIRSKYQLAWQFSRMEPNRNYNGMSCTENVVEGSKDSVRNIREMCKEKYGIDIHFEIYGSPASDNPV